MDTFSTHGSTLGPAERFSILDNLVRTSGLMAQTPWSWRGHYMQTLVLSQPSWYKGKQLPGVQDSLVLLEAALQGSLRGYVKHWTILSARRHHPRKKNSDFLYL